MPMLDNPRHERFAQSLAAGKSQAEAYEAAGYKPSEPHASRLASNGKIAARLAELQGRATVGIVLTRQWVLERLIQNYERAAAEDGQGSVANRALELLGKELGMFVERTENLNVTYAVTDEPATEAEWAAEHVTAH